MPTGVCGMNAILIGASSESIFSINEAKTLGFNVIAFDENPNAEGLRLADSSHIIDIKKPELIISKLASMHIAPQLVLPVPIGRYLTSIGSINDYYHLIGIGFEAANYCTDKYKFHRLLSKSGLRNIDCVLVKSGENNLDFSLTYPIIVKPRLGSGSRSVYVVKNRDELKRNFISHMPYDEDFLIESFKPGKEYGLDAVVVQGQFILILLREKLLTSFPYRQCVGYYTVIESDDNHLMFDKIEKYMASVVKLMNLNNVLLHADIIYDNESPFLIEISARPSGHNLHNLFTPLSTGVNMIREYIKFSVPELNQTYSFFPKSIKCMLIRYFDFENCKVIATPNRNKLLESFPLVKYEYNCKKEIMEQIVDSSIIMNRGYFILEGQTREELEKYSNNILNQFVLEKINV
jgi:predicted ATP-grasp superfamily ATP-dependent carboligase